NCPASPTGGGTNGLGTGATTGACAGGWLAAGAWALACCATGAGALDCAARRPMHNEPVINADAIPRRADCDPGKSGLNDSDPLVDISQSEDLRICEFEDLFPRTLKEQARCHDAIGCRAIVNRSGIR